MNQSRKGYPLKNGKNTGAEILFKESGPLQLLHSVTQFHPFSTLPWDDQYPLHHPAIDQSPREGKARRFCQGIHWQEKSFADCYSPAPPTNTIGIGLGYVFPFSIPDPQGIEERCSRSASARRLIEAMPRNPLAGKILCELLYQPGFVRSVLPSS